MKVYVAEQYHDNDCGIWTHLEPALFHWNNCPYCESVALYEIPDDAPHCNFERTESWGNDKYVTHAIGNKIKNA